MRRLPIVATLVVLAAAAVMAVLGLWQLERAQWKERLLAEFAAAAAMPALDLDPLLARGAPLPPLSFRRVLVTCRAEQAVPELRGGQSRDGQGGFRYLVPCRPGADGAAARLMIDAGWSRLPDEDLRVSLDGIVAGTVAPAGEDGPIRVISASAQPPLAPSAAPSAAAIPNNHLFYAFQWFFFAAAALVIYALALRRRLSRPDPGPTSAP